MMMHGLKDFKLWKSESLHTT